MRAKCLSYYGERMLTATSQCFGDSMASDEFTCQALPQHLERSLQSDELSGKWYNQASQGINLLQMFENHGRRARNINPVNVDQNQAIRALGASLRRAADSMQNKPASSNIHVNPTALLKEG